VRSFIEQRLTPRGYRYGGRVIYTADGTFAKADYPGLRAIIVEAQGAGGGGGGAPTTGVDQWSAGAGGEGGGYATSLIPISDLDTSEAVTVGQGGAGGTTGSGGTGEASVFDTISGEVNGAGGDGGSGGVALAASRVDGATPGTSSQTNTGDLVIPGQYGQWGTNGETGINPIGRGGGGGHSHLGAGGPWSGANNAAGVAGRGYGGGGSGGNNNESQGTSRDGGPGADGVVIVHLLY
jgi:hypothetical protein